MRILIFHQFYTRLNEPGISRFNLFACYWAKEGIETEVIAGMINYQTGKKKEEYKRKFLFREKDGNVSVVRVFDSGFGYRTFLGRVFSYGSFMFFALLAGLFLAKPDIIIVSSPPIFLGVTAYLVSVLRQRPFVLELRDLWPDEAIELGVVKNRPLIKFSYFTEKFLYKRAKLIIVNSPGFKEFLMKEKNIGANKIGVVPNPVDPVRNCISNEVDFNLITSPDKKKKIELFKEALGWKNRFVVLYSGAYSFVYDFNPLIEAAKNLEEKEEKGDVLFVLIGDGRQKPALIEKINKEKIKNVRFFDSVPKDKIGYFIAGADVCVAPLKKMRLLRYVYASKLFDYMAAAKPIVLAMEGVSVELVCDKAKAGICVEPGNTEQFQKAIVELYNNHSKIRKFGDNGYKFVKENFPADKLAEEYLEYLNRLRNTK